MELGVSTDLHLWISALRPLFLRRFPSAGELCCCPQSRCSGRAVERLFCSPRWGEGDSPPGELHPFTHLYPAQGTFSGSQDRQEELPQLLCFSFKLLSLGGASGGRALEGLRLPHFGGALGDFQKKAPRTTSPVSKHYTPVSEESPWKYRLPCQGKSDMWKAALVAGKIPLHPFRELWLSMSGRTVSFAEKGCSMAGSPREPQKMRIIQKTDLCLCLPLRKTEVGLLPLLSFPCSLRP